MTLNVAIQMDPIGSITITKDSTFILGLEAQKRGFALHYYEPWQLSLRDGKVTAPLRKLTLHDVRDAHREGNKDTLYFTLGEVVTHDLAVMDVVLMRQDPPFDMAYITACHMLEMLPPSTQVVNNAASVRGAPEKLLPLLWPHLCPPTLVTRDKEQVRAFFAEFTDIIIKPLHMFGGADVIRVTPKDNLEHYLETMLYRYGEPLVIQRFLPEVEDGDKRIILIDGEPVGAMHRIPQKGSVRANLMAGGKAQAATLTERDKEVCATIGPELKKRNLLLVGIDMIGDYLTEINVTSPTCLQEINRFNNDCLESLFWDAVCSKL